jgi:hydroxyacylglutathione hydrolase
MTEDGPLRVGDVRIESIVTASPWRVNAYVVADAVTGETAVFDPGDDATRIVSTIRSFGGTVKYLLFTHAHHDHVGAAAELAREFGIPCMLHRGDERLLRHAPMYALRFAGVRLEAPRPYETFETAPELRVGGLEIAAVHTPGHTPGSVCYAVGNVVFTGDTLLREGVGRTDLPGGDGAALAASVDLLLSGLTDDTLLLPGHGEPWLAGDARRWWAAARSAPRAFRGGKPDSPAARASTERSAP